MLDSALVSKLILKDIFWLYKNIQLYTYNPVLNSTVAGVVSLL